VDDAARAWELFKRQAEEEDERAAAWDSLIPYEFLVIMTGSQICGGAPRLCKCESLNTLEMSQLVWVILKHCHWQIPLEMFHLAWDILLQTPTASSRPNPA
jgi:hypothetical protein